MQVPFIVKLSNGAWVNLSLLVSVEPGTYKSGEMTLPCLHLYANGPEPHLTVRDAKDRERIAEVLNRLASLTQTYGGEE